MSQWLQGTPGEGGVPVMPGTSPTSWYTTPENVQHIAYVGTDQKIHECFFFIGGENKWFHSTPSEGGVPVMPGTSPTSWYTTPENVQHIAYVGTDQKVHECFFFIGGENKWFFNTPSEGGVPVMPGTSPTSWYTTPENVQHVAYVGTDQKVHECFYFIGGENTWFLGTLSEGGPLVMPGTSPTSWYTTPENVQHVAYVGTDQKVHECFFFIGGENRWFLGTPSEGGVPVMPGTSPTSWYTTPENVQHIAYVGLDQKVHECFFFIGGDNRWLQNTPSEGAVAVAPGTSPTSWYTTPENVQHIGYVGTDQKIHESFFFISPPLPARLQFRLRYFRELESTDDVGGDTVWIGGVGLDSAAVTVGPDHRPTADPVTAPRVGDVSDDRVRDGWRTSPHVLLDFDLRRNGDWPRSFTATLLIVEEDAGDVDESFTKLGSVVVDEVRSAAVSAAQKAAGALVGAVVGSAVPGVGTVVGAAVGALAGAVFDAIVDEIKAGLANDVFTPIPLTLTVPDPRLIRQHRDIGEVRTLTVRENGAHYEIDYDWHLVE
ncbi:glycine zipper domain-containing protein [Actinosynnema sp. NPDC059335]|uniref:glycine zipper domain-containing protein n=1 Tax=Actinosynnema sp. NPDC059335 TaxID=3346804 RepID=UPI00366C3624